MGGEASIVTHAEVDRCPPVSEIDQRRPGTGGLPDADGLRRFPEMPGHVAFRLFADLP